ncbi:MAG TPA: hypothetical protein VFY40_14335 [Blastocatellia bacterium]|nr:hypothetical protein [Blastocatellia bacterium]
MRAEFRREGESFKANCGKFSLTSIVGCGEVLFLGHPLHIAVGSVAPLNGFGFGPAFVRRWNPNNNWRLSINADGVVSNNGSWRAGFYLKAVRTKIEPGTSTVRPYPVFNVHAQTTSLNKIAYYGSGNLTSRADQTFFGMRETIVGASVVYPVFKPLNLALLGEINGRFVDIRGSNGNSGPSIEQIHTETTAPGLASQPAFAQFGQGVRARPTLFSDYLRLNYSLNFQQFVSGGSGYSFRRLTLDLSHQIPIYKKTRTLLPRDNNGPDDCSSGSNSTDCPRITLDREGSIGLRMLLSESFTSSGNVVPFYFQPTLGGSDINGQSSLAAFQDYRFRAPNLLLFQGSIEHSLYGPVGLSFRAETGRVAITRGGLGFEGMVRSYSAGLTLRAGGFPMVSVMYAWGSNEGTRTIATMNTSLLGGAGRPSLY